MTTTSIERRPLRLFNALSCFLLALLGSQPARANFATTTIFNVVGSYYEVPNCCSPESLTPTFDGTFALNSSTLDISNVSIVDKNYLGAILNKYVSGHVVDETGRCDIFPTVSQACYFTELNFSGMGGVRLNLVVDLPLSFSSDVPNIIQMRDFYVSASGPMSHADSFGSGGQVMGGLIEGGTITAAPEPGTVLLFMTAMAAMIWRFRTKRV